jgi:hypothetical protein
MEAALGHGVTPLLDGVLKINELFIKRQDETLCADHSARPKTKEKSMNAW